jgi:hypothetical protein
MYFTFVSVFTANYVAPFSTVIVRFLPYKREKEASRASVLRWIQYKPYFYYCLVNTVLAKQSAEVIGKGT